jgi:sn-glycerol 3-phosphate transport system permease protein
VTAEPGARAAWSWSRHQNAHVIGWLLVLPALVLLVTFTHYPALATLVASLFSTPKRNRPGIFVGGQQYQAMLADPVFWQSLQNNAVYSLGTIPASIALALLMAVLVNERLAGRGVLRVAYFTPTVLPMIAVAHLAFFYTPMGCRAGHRPARAANHN